MGNSQTANHPQKKSAISKSPQEDTHKLSTMTSLPFYTKEEIYQHNTASSLWLLIKGEVYDVTKFMDEHPGGGDILLVSI